MSILRKSAAQIFEQSILLAPAARAAFLDHECAGLPQLRNEVERLFAGDSEAVTWNGEVSISSETAQLARNAQSHQFQPEDLLCDRFRIVRYIDRGGMGEVYEVEDSQLHGVRLALKTILPHIAAAPNMREHFIREVVLARRVVHPNLCPIYDIFHARHNGSELIFLTMKLLPGETLSARICRDGALSLPEAAQIVAQVASALTAAHDAGILHRDIKAANVMIERDGDRTFACVTDFGLAKAYRTESTVMSTGIGGTPGYMAPELVHGAPPSRASDVYAFGVMVYNMLTARMPSPTSGTKPDPALAGLPPEWIALLDNCLQADVSLRSQSLPEALETLHTADPARRLVAPRNRLSRRSLLALGGTATAATAIGVWLNWPRIQFLLEPLPEKRFITLVGWPHPSSVVAPTIASMLNAIGGELTRAEAFDHNLYVIPYNVSDATRTVAQLDTLRQSLGANLVLAVSGEPRDGAIHLLLELMDSAVPKVLRQTTLTVLASDQLSLAEKAIKAASGLLSLTRQELDRQRSLTGTTNPAAYAAFQAAEAQRKLANDKGLSHAIEKYTQAAELDPHYGLAKARLALAYYRLYVVHRDPAALELARANCQAALIDDPSLVEAHLALGAISDQSGDKPGALLEYAKALSIDPADPEALLYQAQLLTRCNRWDDAEKTFARLLLARPNFWLTHEELGVLYAMEPSYEKSEVAFRAASFAAPSRTLPLSNLSTVYLQLGKVDDAIQAAQKSLAIAPNDGGAVAMAQALRSQKKYSDAVTFASKAVELNPDDPGNWLELADNHSYLSGHRSQSVDAYVQAAKLVEQTLETDPTEGPVMMQFALVHAKLKALGKSAEALGHADGLFAADIDSQLMKVRILELLSRRDDALAAVSACITRGAKAFQFQIMPDLEELRADPRFKTIEASILPTTNTL